MSRGVSFATGSVWKFYLYPERDGETGESFGTMQEDWEDFVEGLRWQLESKFKSLTRCDKWLDREDHAILENDHANIGISEYCGTVCLWCVPKQWDGYRPDNQQIHDWWCCQVEGTVGKLLAKAYPDILMESLGCASNGEQFFRPVNRPEGVVTTKEGRLW